MAGTLTSAPIFTSAKPYVRWWWFSGPIDDAIVCQQLDWVKAQGFGGVEIAWLYPLNNTRLGATWLSTDWARPVQLAARYAATLGLGCDFTLGSAWPFGGLHVPAADASQTYHGLSPQRLEKSWETPLGQDGGYILNHLDRRALERYARRFGDALGLPGDSAIQTPGLFCDSWEVLPEGLWTTGFGVAFQQRFGYDIRPLMPELDAHPDARYDYLSLLAETALDEFYRPYTEICHALGGYARVQCHGAPVDIVAAYALADVPETEAILFDPDFAAFAASAAVLSGKPVVSAEAFTCLYGWAPCPGPGPYQQQERITDLKLIADGLIANGVNQIVWHGMPFNPRGAAQRFYATTHVGPESAFAAQIEPFNRYMEQVCARLRRGHPYTDVAVYLPLEDTWMQGELPLDVQKPSSKYAYELQETKLPSVLKGYRPLWVTARFLRDAAYRDGKLHCGQAVFTWLYVDVGWLDSLALDDLLRLARAGLPLCLVRRPTQPGRAQSPDYDRRVAELVALPNVSPDFRRVAVNPPLLEGADLPDFWCTVNGDDLTLFFAHPLAQRIRYPMVYGQFDAPAPVTRALTLHASGNAHAVELSFSAHQSLMLTLANGGVTVTNGEIHA